MTNEHELDDEALATAAGGAHIAKGQLPTSPVIDPDAGIVYEPTIPTVGNFSQHYLDHVS